MKKRILIAVLMLLALACAGAISEEMDGFRLCADNGELRLYINEETLELRVQESATGRMHATKIMDGQGGNKTTKNAQKSHVRVYYVVNEFVGTRDSMDSYPMSVSYSEYEITDIDGGVEVRYTIGDMTISVEDLPKMVPLEKYYDKLLPNWSERDDKAFREYYRVYQNTMWVRTDDGNIGKVKLQNLYKLFYEVGTYTREDLEEDNAAYGHELTKVNPRIGITVRFTLDGSDLLVSVPCDTIEFTEGNPVTRIDLLPYFLSAGTEDEGYMLVPDGSGSLIYLNNGKLSALSYTDTVYGSDVLRNTNTYKPASEPIRMPVYGIKTQDGATLAIIEKGAELAGLYADVSGRSDAYNRIYSYFMLRDIEFVSLIGSGSGSTPRYPDDVYDGEIVVRYKFLNDDAANYTGMAHAYREYLLSRGMLSESEMPEEAPFFVDLIGAVRKTKFLAGIPYKSTIAATTLSQASEIVDALADAGVKKPILLLDGFLKGGVKHASLSEVRVESAVGKARELNELAEKTAALGGGVYLTVNAEKVYTTENFKKSSQASRRIDNFTASVTSYAEPLLAEQAGYVDSFYVSPAYLGTYVERFLQALGKARLDISGLAVDDLGNLLVGDYRNKANISRVHATETAQRALDALAGNGGLLLNAPNDYALAHAEMIYNLPSGDNDHKVEDAAIPFMQLVLEGTSVYTTRPWNEGAYDGVHTQLLYAVESKSAPHFRLTYEDETVFLHTEDFDAQNRFMTRYDRWLDDIESAAARYGAFWRTVADERIVAHEILASGVRRIRYTGDVTVYVNYGSADAMEDGITVPAQDFVVMEAQNEK